MSAAEVQIKVTRFMLGQIALTEEASTSARTRPILLEPNFWKEKFFLGRARTRPRGRQGGALYLLVPPSSASPFPLVLVLLLPLALARCSTVCPPLSYLLTFVAHVSPTLIISRRRRGGGGRIPRRQAAWPPYRAGVHAIVKEVERPNATIVL